MRLSTIILYLFAVILNGCVSSWRELAGEDVNSELVNYALASYGTRVYVSGESSEHPASTLNNGITDSEQWDQGEGWQVQYEGPYAYGRYFAYGQNTVVAASAALSRERYARLQGEQVTPTELDPNDYEEKDDNWRGLRGNDSYSGGVQSAFGWTVLEFPQEVQLTKVIVFGLDSTQYPAAQYGPNHIRVQYWTESSIGAGWSNVDRHNKQVGQQDDSIRDIKRGRIEFRFRPVKTRKIRVAILWTNDAERYRTFGRRHYSRGTVRLVEIEAYGLEKLAQDDRDSTQAQDGAERLIDQVLTETEPDAKPADVAGDEEEAMTSVVRAYADAYASGNVVALMRTISPRYAQNGNGVEGLRTRMTKLFKEHSQPDFALQELTTDSNSQTITAKYRLLLEKDGQPLSGTLQFSMERTTTGWLIRQIQPVQ